MEVVGLKVLIKWFTVSIKLLNVPPISLWIICDRILQRNYFFQKWEVLSQEKYLNSIMILFTFLQIMYLLPCTILVCCAETNGYTFLLSMLLLLKDLFCFICLRAARETTSIWVQSNNETIVLLDVVFFEERMLVRVCYIWGHTWIALETDLLYFSIKIRIALHKLKLKKKGIIWDKMY